MSSVQTMVLSYLRNMQAAQANNHPEHAASLFTQAMEWSRRIDQHTRWEHSPVRFSIGMGLDIGTNPRRVENQDYAFADRAVRDLACGSPEAVGIFVVADGVGGSVNGQEASRLAVHAFVDYVYPRLLQEPLYDLAVKELLVEGVRKANEVVYQRNQDPFLLGSTMLTTFVAIVSVGTDAWVVGLGDSRAYLYRRGEGLLQLTQDHSQVANLVRAGMITAQEVYTHPKRNEIYRALGMAAEVPIDEPVPLQLQDEDRLLLCSDGLWEMVRDPQGADIVKILASRQHSAGEMAESLVQLALRGGGPNNIGGGHDNVAVVVAHVEVNYANCPTILLPPTPEIAIVQ